MARVAYRTPERARLAGVIGERLRQALEARGETLSGFADRAGLQKGTLSRLRHGGFVPGGELLVRLADALEVSVDWLVGRE